MTNEERRALWSETIEKVREENNWRPVGKPQSLRAVDLSDTEFEPYGDFIRWLRHEKLSLPQPMVDNLNLHTELLTHFLAFEYINQHPDTLPAELLEEMQADGFLPAEDFEVLFSPDGETEITSGFTDVGGGVQDSPEEDSPDDEDDWWRTGKAPPF